MPATRIETIGPATLYLGDAFELLPELPRVGAVIVDPPYSERCHTRHDGSALSGNDEANRRTLGYQALTLDHVDHLARAYAAICGGWIVWMCDSDLALAIRTALERTGRYAFPPLPFYQPGRSVRLSGDGPSSWTDWIVCARTAGLRKWGTLPGGYAAGYGMRDDKARMGGKPTWLMDALVRDYSRPGDTVLDSHMGAGTTGVSCVKLGRQFIGCEIDPEAFDIACSRIEAATRQRSLFEPIPAQQQTALFGDAP